MQSLWLTNNLNYNMLKWVRKCGSYCHFSQLHKIDKTTTITAKRYVNELVIPRTKGQLIEKTYQVNGL